MKIIVCLTLLSICLGARAADLHPIVEVKTGYFFGAVENGKWIKAESAAKRVSAKTSYRVYGLTGEVGTATGAKPKSIEEPCPDTMEVKLSAQTKGGVIALAAPWNALPRKAQIGDTTQKVYLDAVRDFLGERGLPDPTPKITRLLRVDLDGDGEEEVLISATNYLGKSDEAPTETPKIGDYSVVLLRRVVAGKVQTELLAGELYKTSNEPNTPSVYEIPAVLDLDGDGKLEVVIHSYYYEGAATMILRYEAGKMKKVLEVECGV